MKKSAAYFGLFTFGNCIRLREWNWKMESGANTKEVLTPKNVYRFLTDNLPGLYPHGVIPAAERKGLTLVKFWAQVLDGIIPPEWHASLFGGTQRSRRLSDMMNRTGVQPLPPKLQQEMNALLSGETLIRLSQQVQDFLRSAHYDADALTRALPDFVRMMMENEECMKPEHEQVFENLQKSRETLPRTFVDMLTLSWLVLLAFYGPEMGSRELLDFCQAQEHSAQALYLLSSHVTFGRRVPLSMTGRNCELCRQGLSKDEYVMDAASCLPQLTDAIRQGGKIAVTGMGGIGKTEMTRQALALLAKEELFSRMAWVQYENSLASSLRMAFDGLDGVAEENVLSTVREKLEAPYQGRTLLLIDSVDMPPEADEGLREIEHWGCDVLVTTRFPLGEGFRNIAVPLLSEEASRALFVQHDPYLQGMGSAETEALHQVLSRVAGHPLAIILLAHLAKMKRWTMALLLEELDRISPEGLRLAGGKFSAIAQRIAQMVSTDALTDRERQVLAVFATFPAWTIPVRDALTLLRDFGTEDELLSALETAADYGLLTSNWRGYAMHPVLAESFRPLLPPMEKVPRLAEVFEECRACWEAEDVRMMSVMPLALCTISEFADAPVEMMSGVIAAIFYVRYDSCEKIPAVRLKQWRLKKKDECEKTQRGRFLSGCLGLALDEIIGGDLEQDCTEMVENLAASREGDVKLLLMLGGSAGSEMGQKNFSKLIARIGELIPPNHPDAARMRMEKTVLAIMNMDSFSPEELEAAISYGAKALDDPKHVGGAATALSFLLYQMGVIGIPEERIKALAELVEEKTKDVDDLPNSFYMGMENVFHNLREYDKALSYSQRALDAIELTQKDTGMYFTMLHNHLQLRKEMGHLMEVQDVIIEALAKVKKLFGENNVLCCSYKAAYISVLMERRENEKADEEIQKLIPILRELEGEIGAKDIEMMCIRTLAQMGREEEALELGEQIRAFIHQVGGEDGMMMKYLERGINNVKTGVYRPKT